MGGEHNIFKRRAYQTAKRFSRTYKGKLIFESLNNNCFQPSVKEIETDSEEDLDGVPIDDDEDIDGVPLNPAPATLVNLKHSPRKHNHSHQKDLPDTKWNQVCKRLNNFEVKSTSRTLWITLQANGTHLKPVIRSQHTLTVQTA